jgi:hypothetical protein
MYIYSIFSLHNGWLIKLTEFLLLSKLPSFICVYECVSMILFRVTILQLAFWLLCKRVNKLKLV